MERQFSRREGRKVWVDLVEPNDSNVTFAFLDALRSLEEELDELVPEEELILADVNRVQRFIHDNYQGTIALSSLDYALQAVHTRFGLQVFYDKQADRDVRFIRFDDADGVKYALDDGEITDADWEEVLGLVQAFPVSIIPLERTPFEAGDEDPVAEETWTIDGADGGVDITLITRTDWDGLQDPCPECGEAEFNHVKTSAGHYGHSSSGTPVCRNDHGRRGRTLLTTCRNCNAVLFKHPSADLLLDAEATNEEAVVRP